MNEKQLLEKSDNEKNGIRYIVVVVYDVDAEKMVLYQFAEKEEIRKK